MRRTEVIFIKSIVSDPFTGTFHMGLKFLDVILMPSSLCPKELSRHVGIYLSLSIIRRSRRTVENKERTSNATVRS